MTDKGHCPILDIYGWGLVVHVLFLPLHGDENIPLEYCSRTKFDSLRPLEAGNATAWQDNLVPLWLPPVQGFVRGALQSATQMHLLWKHTSLLLKAFKDVVSYLSIIGAHLLLWPSRII